jgi:ribosomal protein S18 acetylase RimI-like enzyme
VRYLTDSDVEQLEELDRKCFPAPVRYNRHALSYYLSLPTSFGLAEFNDVSLIGFIIVTLTSNESANIVTIDIEPSLRCQGFGSKLIRLATNVLLSWKVKKITLQVSVDNDVAIKFYKKHKFTITKTLPMYYPTTDGYKMERDIC